MSVDAIIEELGAEARAAVEALLRRAYETGYREALATAGEKDAAVPVVVAAPAEPVVLAVPATPAPVAWVQPLAAVPNDPPDDDSDESDDEVEAEAPAPRPIMANAKVGTLRRRIIRTFDLERFEIDVVICRSGDPDRRQLKSSARLALYRRGEG